MKLPHHSPSSLNLFCASPAMFVLERIVGQKQPVGAIAHRGTAVEHGVALGLSQGADDETCTSLALQTYDSLTALTSDPRRDDCRTDIAAMVVSALEELRPYGKPTKMQGKVEWQPEGLGSPILGYFDFAWEDHGILTDLKTTERMPSSIKTPHARQVALYAQSDNIDARLTYVTPKKRASYRLENIRAHRAALHQIALRVERFLALSDDPDFFVSITAPDVESFYWTSPRARQLAYDLWSI